ncbi:hypothetical protein BC941DRAFT_422496 [Chlamydoabsidia padenii]|nr:hypothetical protein BC941DRAFT_422496 [Chlamydoabsidia padenii]
MFESFHKQDDIFKNTEEVPASVPVFEGYLYWYSDKQKWKWHLFRFDGLSFICLSTRKVKLPRNTPIEQDAATDPNMPSPTSPLLATPKQPYTPYTDDSTVMASHYQLPSWSVNLLQVTSISLLALNDKPQHRHCFCIRTKGNKCFLLKARKQKDLDRWLFVLTKAWHWAQNKEPAKTLSPSPPPQLPPLNISPPNLINDKSSRQPPTPPPHFNDQQEYEANYKNPILSAEKEKWIDEWRDSLRTMAMPMCHQNKTCPSVLDQSAINNKDDTEKDIGTNRSSVQQQRPVSMMCHLTDQISFGNVKKKRSDEVKNWMPGQHQEHQDYDVHYFQDANTTEHANDTSTHHNSNYSGDRHSSPLLHYHRSTRGRNVQIITQNQQQQQQQQQPGTNISPSPSHVPTSSFNKHSPLYTLSKAESTHDVYRLQSTTRQRPLSTPINIDTIQQGLPPGVYYPHKSSNTVIAPSQPPVPPNYTLYGSVMSSSSSSTCPVKKWPPLGGGAGDNLVFYPSRSTPTRGTPLVSSPLHSLVKSSTRSLIPTSSFPTL